jgi:hypothetical protein
VGFVVNTPSGSEEIRERLVQQDLSLESEPRGEGGVDPCDAPVGPSRQISAWRVLVEIFEVFFEDVRPVVPLRGDVAGGAMF